MRRHLKSLNRLLKILFGRLVDMSGFIFDFIEEVMVGKNNIAKPADVTDFLSLRQWAQQLCDEPNHVDGIIVIEPASDEKFYLSTCTQENFQGIDLDALGSSLLRIATLSDDMIISSRDFNPGNVRLIIYEFDNIAMAVYGVLVDSARFYLALVNSKDKDLGAFNASRPRVRAQMEVALRNHFKHKNKG